MGWKAMSRAKNAVLHRWILQLKLLVFRWMNIKWVGCQKRFFRHYYVFIKMWDENDWTREDRTLSWWTVGKLSFAIGTLCAPNSSLRLFWLLDFIPLGAQAVWPDFFWLRGQRRRRNCTLSFSNSQSQIQIWQKISTFDFYVVFTEHSLTKVF